MSESLRTQRVFDGPSIWDASPVTHFVVDAAHLLPVPTTFDALFAELEPYVHEGVSLAPISVSEARDAASLIGLLAVNLQRLAGIPVRFFAGRPRPDGGGFDIVVEHVHPPVGRMATRLALRYVAQLVGQGETSFDLANEFQRFVQFNEACDGGVMGRAIRAAIAQRGIPVETIDPRGRLIELGTGRYRQRMVGRITSLTPATALQIERDKFLTTQYLRAAGLPVPESRIVRSLPEALSAARAIGYPVVLKPLDMGASVGVVLDIREPDALAACFEDVATIAATRSGWLMVERYLHGNHYRATVVNDRVTGVGQRVYPQVVGNGVDTIRRLIEIENTNPKRSHALSSVYKQITIDEQVIAQLAVNDWTLDDVPPVGQVVQVKSGHRQEGEIHLDVTDRLHPDNAAMFCLATRVAGLPLAGIDIVLPDIAQSMWETGGGIIELNADTAFNLQLFPAEGLPRDPGPAIIDMLFPPGQPVRIPVVATMAADDSALVCEEIARAFTEAGQRVGVATRDGVTIGGTRYTGVEGRNPNGPRTVLNNPMADIAVVEVDAEGIVEHGLGFGACDVAIVPTLSGLLRPDGRPVETVLLDALDGAGIALLNQDDPAVAVLGREVREVVTIGSGRASLPAPVMAHVLRACSTAIGGKHS